MNGDPKTAAAAAFVVKADPFVRDLLPEYLANRAREPAQINDLLGQRDFKAIKRLGHNIKGSAAAYGIAPLSELGAAIEAAGLAESEASVREAAQRVGEFLQSVRIE